MVTRGPCHFCQQSRASLADTNPQTCCIIGRSAAKSVLRGRE